MSLVKLDKNGRIRESWAEKKTTKRLKIILEKVRKNQSRLFKLERDLKQYGFEATKIHTEWGRFLLLGSALHNIIIRRLRNEGRLSTPR